MHTHTHSHTHSIYFYLSTFYCNLFSFFFAVLTHTPLPRTCMVCLIAEVVSSVSRPVFYSSVPMALLSQRRPTRQCCSMPWKVTASLALNSKSNESIAVAATHSAHYLLTHLNCGVTQGSDVVGKSLTDQEIKPKMELDRSKWEKWIS